MRLRTSRLPSGAERAAASATLAGVADRLAPLLGAIGMPLYLYGAVVTHGGGRWAMLAVALLLTLSLTRGAKQPTRREATTGAIGCVAAIVMWAALAPDESAARAALLTISMVYVGLMLPRPFAEIALVASVVAYAGSGLVFETGSRLDLQAVGVAVTDFCLGMLMLGIRLTTERKVNDHTRALGAVNDQLELLNRTDPLTGLANRRRLDDALAETWTGGDPISVIMVDIDYFKQYNDRFGHPGGDVCLQKVAAVLKATARGTDIVARYGGEEFAVILPDTDLTTAGHVAERIRDTVARLNESHPASPTGYLTVSLGVASAIPDKDLYRQDLLRRADEGLYSAKNNGRNQTATAAG